MTTLSAAAQALPGLYIAALVGITIILWALVLVGAIEAQRAITNRTNRFWIAGVFAFLSYFPASLVLMAGGIL